LGHLLQGVALGFPIAAAVGPISLLTIRRTLAHGRLYGLVSGLGVATADATYAGVAAFGLTAITATLVGVRGVLGLVGGAILVLMAIRTLISSPAETAAADARPSLPGAYLSIFALTMTNPMTILSFAAVFAGLGVIGQGGAEAALITLGVFLGSALWWVVLTTAVGVLRTRVSMRVLSVINRVSGAILLVFGALAIASTAGRW
jgi:threonine/homoserine/homoserine lactone efflux protein